MTEVFNLLISTACMTKKKKHIYVPKSLFKRYFPGTKPKVR